MAKRRQKPKIKGIDDDIAYWMACADAATTQAWMMFLGIAFGLRMAKERHSAELQQIPVDYQI